jgi:hypothetical protein
MNLTGILEAHDDLVVDLGHVQIVAGDGLEIINGGRTIKAGLDFGNGTASAAALLAALVMAWYSGRRAPIVRQLRQPPR